MKLPSGMEVKNETLSEIADFIAMDMLSTECSYSDSCSMVAEELEGGYEGEHETLESMGLEDRQFLLELIRVLTLKYLEELRRAKSEAFDQMLKPLDWAEELSLPLAECYREKFHVFAYDVNGLSALDRAKAFAKEHNGRLYTQVDTEDGLYYLAGEYKVNRTGVYGVLID